MTTRRHLGLEGLPDPWEDLTLVSFSKGVSPPQNAGALHTPGVTAERHLPPSSRVSSHTHRHTGWVKDVCLCHLAAPVSAAPATCPATLPANKHGRHPDNQPPRHTSKARTKKSASASLLRGTAPGCVRAGRAGSREGQM